MTWDKLVDRCLLFTDAPGGLLKELLKEAEQELSHELELYDALYTIQVPNTLTGGGISTHAASQQYVDRNYFHLPPEYVRDVAVYHEGTRLKKLTEDEIYRQSNDNTVPGGTPTGYSIAGEFIVFNRAPKQSDKFLLHYKESLTNRSADRVLTILSYVETGGTNDFVMLNTEHSSELAGLQYRWEKTSGALAASGSISGQPFGFITGIPGLPDKGDTNNIHDMGASVGQLDSNNGLSIYKVTQKLGLDLSANPEGSRLANGITSINGSMIIIKNFRSKAPLIPNRFHASLCDYAVALANAKSSPELYNTYWTKWSLSMDKYVNQSLDRDLMHSIKEEI